MQSFQFPIGEAKELKCPTCYGVPYVQSLVVYKKVFWFTEHTEDIYWPILMIFDLHKRGNSKRQLFSTLLYNEIFKAIGHFRHRKKKVHRFTNNLQGLQKVMVKDFS